MNQMQKRLEIIKIAISMTDEETVKLQLLKLECFENDSDLSEIINLLKQKYYAKAQAMITRYNTTTNIKADNNISREINTQEVEKKLDSINENTTNKNRITIKISKSSNHFTTKNIMSPEVNIGNEPDNKMNASTTPLLVLDEKIEKKSKIIPLEYDLDHEELTTEENILSQNEDYSKYYSLDEQKQNDTNDDSKNTEMKSSAEQTEKSPNTDSTLSTGSNNTMYEKLPNISIVFHDKLPHYFLGQTVIVSKSTVSWMKHIASGRYQDSEIHKILSHVNTLKEEGNFSEAAQLMLVCGLTESNLGRLVFARELIKGDIFEKNETQAFELIKELALSGYDEAICDYGQLVEHGIGTEADSKYAEELYKEAVSMDLERGRRLYENIRKKNHKFLSFLRG